MKRRFAKRQRVSQAPPAMASCVKVLIVDDHPLLRDGATRWIDAEPDLKVCGAAANAAQALELVPKVRPDLAVVDLSLQHSSGLSLVQEMHLRFPRLPVLVLSMHDESDYAERAVKAGAKGYVTKQEPPSVLVQAIHCIMSGHTFLSATVTDRLLHHQVEISPPSSHAAPGLSLSERESEVFELIGHGYNTREIAQRLGRSQKTIAAHRENIKRKLNLTSSSELVRRAMQWLQHQPVQLRAA